MEISVRKVDAICHIVVDGGVKIVGAIEVVKGQWRFYHAPEVYLTLEEFEQIFIEFKKIVEGSI